MMAGFCIKSEKAKNRNTELRLVFNERRTTRVEKERWKVVNYAINLDKVINHAIITLVKLLTM